MSIFPYEPQTRDFDKDTRHSRTLLVVFLCLVSAYGLARSGFDIAAMARGLGAIIVSPDILINDYLSISGPGPAFVNAALCVAVAILILRVSAVAVSGPAIAAVFTIAGFGLFGKNIVNIWPGILGSFLYSIASHRPFRENIIVALFGTALAPLSSEVAFGIGLAPPWNVAAALAIGAVVGFLLSPIARHVLDFHRGYNLYNIGFSAGLIGTVVMSSLKAFDVRLDAGFHWAELGPAGSLPWFAACFAGLIVAGILLDARWRESYKQLLGSSGRLVSDFVRFYGIGATFINMGLMGFLASAVMLAIGASWNGPMMGGLLTIVGFSAFGKHPRNTLPPMLGAAAMAMMSRYGLGSPGSQLAVLFASTLAPVAGEYGPVAGFVVGMLHLVLVQVVGTLHGGLNLYNNGFAGGLAAGLILPVLEWLREWRRHEV